MSYHFIGMGGIGMSALARILLQRGQKVQGSDIRPSALLDELAAEGASVDIGQSGETIREGDTVVYSTDIKSENPEMKKAFSLQLPMLHRSDLLHLLMKSQKPLLVTGTHGKTTTSALLAEVLREAGKDPSFVIGGLLRSLNTNGREGKGEYFVAEADESDGSFLKTNAFGAIVTNLEEEHLSYWKTFDRLREAFRQFFDQAQSRALFWCCDDFELCKLAPKGASYGFSERADWRITDFSPISNGVRFDLTCRGQTFKGIEIALFGRHNAQNASAVFALAITLGINEESIRRAFKAFSGTGRRLELIGSAQNIEIFDDYGHHPTEIRETLSALRGRIGERRLIAIFQPHRYTRVRDLFDSFLTCFSEADEVFMTDIYAAGEAPIDSISSASLYMRLREKLGPKVHFFPRMHLEVLAAQLLRPGDSVITLGAGDITFAGKILLEKIRELQPKLTVGVLFGGASAEHDVSLMSARNVLRHLDPTLYRIKAFGVTREGNWIQGERTMERLLEKEQVESKMSPEILQELSQCDVCIPVFHGPRGEDGMIQGFLETLGLPYAGCDYRSSSLSMHKGWTKQVAQMNGIPTAPFFEWRLEEWKENPEAIVERIEEELSFPVWIKPVHLGSSIGVKRAGSASEALEAAALAFSFDDTILVEREILGRQIEFAMLGNERIRVGAVGEVLNQGSFYDYEGKYGALAMPTRAPAELTPRQTEIGVDLAKKVYRACGCQILARIDFFLDQEGCYWLNEINPFPGLTDTSIYPKMWEAAGMSWRELCNEWIILALHRHRKAVAR